jgi:hypothetical protein
MSSVTNIILSFSIVEDRFSLMDDINSWLTKEDYGAFGYDADALGSGTKRLETPVYVAAFNLFDVHAFLDFVKDLPWQEPDCVQVFVQEQEEDKFRVYGASDS